MYILKDREEQIAKYNSEVFKLLRCMDALPSVWIWILIPTMHQGRQCCTESMTKGPAVQSTQIQGHSDNICETKSTRFNYHILNLGHISQCTHFYEINKVITNTTEKYNYMLVKHCETCNWKNKCTL